MRKIIYVFSSLRILLIYKGLMFICTSLRLSLCAKMPNIYTIFVLHNQTALLFILVPIRSIKDKLMGDPDIINHTKTSLNTREISAYLRIHQQMHIFSVCFPKAHIFSVCFPKAHIFSVYPHIFSAYPHIFSA